jgi:TetR/AcrR family transcriptional regulator
MARTEIAEVTGQTVEPKRSRGRPLQKTSVGRDALLRMARRTFARRGYEATSVREIARECGVDVALIAHHCGSKESLWLAVVEQIAEQMRPLLKATEELQQSDLSARTRVEFALGLLIDEVFAQPDTGLFFSTAATEHGGRSDVLIEKLVRPYRDVFVPLLKQAGKAGEISVIDVELSFFMLVNAISKTVSYEHLLSAFSSLPERPVKYKRAVLQTALNMLGPTPAAA